MKRRFRTLRVSAMSAILTTLVLVASLTAPLACTRVAEAVGDTDVASWAELQQAIRSAKTAAVTFKLTGDIVFGVDGVTEENAEGEEAEKPADADEPFVIKNGNRITIDLNGFTIDRGLGGSDPAKDGYTFCIEEKGTLTLTDTSEEPGTITGAANDGDGGAIRCDKNARLVVSGGIIISGNRAKRGGGIFLTEGDDVSIGDVNITQNKVTDNGGGIYGGSSAVLQFSGGLTKIRDNTKGHDDNDLYMTSGMDNFRFWRIPDPTKSKKELSKPFEDNSRIGIILEEYRKEITDGFGKVNPYEGSLVFYYNNEDEYRIRDKNTSEVEVEKVLYKVHNRTTTTLEVFDDKGRRTSEKEYSSFDSALSAGLKVSGKRVITLGGDYTTSDPIEITADITIDLNGHYIKRETEDNETESDGSVFIVKAACTLTIEDSNPKKKGYDGVKGGVITGGKSSNGGGGITVEERGHLAMHGGTIYDCISDLDGGGVYLDTGSKHTSFTATGGKISNCRTVDSTDECFGGGIYLGYGQLNLSNFTIEDCYSEDDGGAIFSTRGEIKLNNVTFSHNKAMERGGAICVDLDLAKYIATSITARNCDFIGNVAGEDGGALCLRDNPEYDGSMLFDRCEFYKNKAGEDGGAIEVLDDGTVLSNVKITKNEAGELGGGIFVDARYDINVMGVVVIKDNTCNKRSDCNDLCLEFGTSVDAHVYSGGLSQGSWIGIGSDTDKSSRLSEDMPVYEMKYFHPSKGTIGPKETYEVDVKMVVTASIFGDGKWIVIAGFGCAGLLLMIAVIVYRRRKQARN